MSSASEAMEEKDGGIQVSSITVISLNEFQLQKCVGTFQLYANVR